MAAEDKIARAVGRYEARREGRPSQISALSGAVRTVPDLLELQATVREKRKRHADYVLAVKNHMLTWRQQRETALASLSPKMREEIISAEEPAELKRARSSAKLFSEDRSRVFSEIQAANASAHVLAHLFSDSLALLDTSTIGSQKRREASADIGDDPFSISGAIEIALASGNRDMLAAAVAKARTLSPRDKDLLRWSPREAADALLAHEIRHAQAALKSLEISAEEVRQESARLDGAVIPTQDKLTLGMARKELEALAPEFLADDPPEPAVA